jgi:ABC-type phosphonate transport system ATPase subunit
VTGELAGERTVPVGARGFAAVRVWAVRAISHVRIRADRVDARMLAMASMREKR